ncbi:LuxR C-terminal-related transcriptional regulator [Streptomyces sp. NPDC102270]|uniref:LuxR C-terminal-related transcriptional regulator n=1 Tax=Streptomyces sp. NPDC102270 TaxID=3366150 RepID=UPI003826D4C9
MPSACDRPKTPPAEPPDAAPAPDAHVAIPLDARDLAILRLTADGRRRHEIAVACGCSTITVDTRTHRLCEVLAADNREHLAALGAAYGLVTREHLDGVPTIRPAVHDDDQSLLDLIVTGLSGARIAARLRRAADAVWADIRRLVTLFGAANRCRLATFAVLTGAVSCHAVSPRFTPQQLPGQPPLSITPTGTGVLLHTPLPFGSAAKPRRRSRAGRSAPTDTTRPSVQLSPNQGAPAQPAGMPSLPKALAAWAENHAGSRPAWTLPDDGSGARCWGLSTPPRGSSSCASRAPPATCSGRCTRTGTPPTA